MAQKRNKALIFVFITLLIDVMGIGIIIPILPKLLQNLTGGSISDVAQYNIWLTLAYSIMQFICSPILGGLSDQYGRRPVLLLSLFGFGIDYIFLGFAPSIWWLFLGRIIAGILGASFSTAGAYIADVSEPEKRAQNFGLIGAAFGLGFILGPPLGGVISDVANSYGFDGSRAPFFVSAGMSLLNFIYGYFVLPESLKLENRRPFDWKRANPIGSLRQLNKYPVIWSLLLPMFLISIAAFATQSTWTYYVMEKFNWKERAIGLSLGMVGVMSAIVQGGLTRVIIPKLGNNKTIYFALICYAISFPLYAFATQGWMMYAIIVIGAMGGMSMPAMQSIMANQVPANAQGELRGSMTSLMSLTAIVGPAIMLGLFSHFTSKNTPIYFPGAPFIAGFFFTVISLVLIYRVLKK